MYRSHVHICLKCENLVRHEYASKPCPFCESDAVRSRMATIISELRAARDTMIEEQAREIDRLRRPPSLDCGQKPLFVRCHDCGSRSDVRRELCSCFKLETAPDGT